MSTISDFTAFFLFETTKKKTINLKPDLLLVIKEVFCFGAVTEKWSSGSSNLQ